MRDSVPDTVTIHHGAAIHETDELAPLASCSRKFFAGGAPTALRSKRPVVLERTQERAAAASGSTIEMDARIGARQLPHET